jgi:hypothetical protein
MGFGCGLEVRYERAVRFDGDDRAVVLPDLLEERRQEAVALGGRGLCLPERGEVRQQPLGLGELRSARGASRSISS